MALGKSLQLIYHNEPYINQITAKRFGNIRNTGAKGAGRAAWAEGRAGGERPAPDPAGGIDRPAPANN